MAGLATKRQFFTRSIEPLAPFKLDLLPPPRRRHGLTGVL